MINYKNVEISDKEWVDPLLAAANVRGCHYSFTNLFAWTGIYKYRIAQVEGYLVVKAVGLDGSHCYFYPAGRGDPQPVIEAMIEDAGNWGNGLQFVGLAPEHIAELDRLFPSQFEYSERRDSFDYVYLLDKLVTLSGKELRAKRNHINIFKRNHDWSFEPISSKNLAECWEMNVEWCKIHDCKYDVQLDNERCAVRRCFDYFDELGLEGGLLRAEGRVIAYTMGDQLNSDTFDVHIEKAFEDIQGAYQMINHEFAVLIQQNHPEMIYVNREEDMGQEGLRKSKLSYHPVRLEEKYWGRLVGSKELTSRGSGIRLCAGGL